MFQSCTRMDKLKHIKMQLFRLSRLTTFSIYLLLNIIVLNAPVFAQETSKCLDEELSQRQRLTACLKSFDAARQKKDEGLTIKFAFLSAELHQKLQDYSSSNSVLLTLDQLQLPMTNTIKVKHKLLRKIGQNYYFMKDYSKSLSFFQKAFDIAEVDNQLIEMGKSYNDLGIVYKAQSRYSDSLNAYLQSLKIKEALNLSEEVGNTLNNIGNMYILMGDYQSAYTYHNRALNYYLQQAEKDQNVHETIIHAKSQIGVALAEIEGIDVAIAHLEKAIIDAEELNNPKMLLFDTYCALAEFYLAKNQTHKAEIVMQNISEVDQLRSNQSLQRLMVMSKINEANALYDEAQSLANQGLKLSQDIQNSEQVTLFLGQLVSINIKMQEYQKALDLQSQYIESKESYLLQRYNTGVKYLQNEIEIQEQQQDLDSLHQDNEIQELLIKKQKLTNILIILINVILIVLLVWLIVKRNKERKKLLVKINYHRNKLKEMQAPKEKLKEFFEPIKEPLICLDQMGSILFFNEAFDENYANEKKPIIGKRLADLYPQLSETLSQISLDSDDMPQQQQLLHRTKDDKEIRLWIDTLNFFDNAIVISFQDDNTKQSTVKHAQQFVENANIIEGLVKKLHVVMKDNNPSLTNQLVKQLDEKLTSIDTQESRSENYRLSLINLMSANLEMWRKTTQGDRVSLAEKSCIWRVTIDEGRLRTRAMDRYLSLKHLPKSPRWRPVVKTTHYILSECTLTDEQRNGMNQLLETFMFNLRSHSLRN